MKYLQICGISLLLVSIQAVAADAKHGGELFNTRACVACHAIGSQGSATVGPNLAGVTKERSESWLFRWIKAPEKMGFDPVVTELKSKYHTEMPDLWLTDDEVRSLILYLQQMDASKH